MDHEKEDIKRLEAFKMWLWRRMEKISWTEHISNEEVLRMVGEERSMLATINQSIICLLIHIVKQKKNKTEGIQITRHIMET